MKHSPWRSPRVRAFLVLQLLLGFIAVPPSRGEISYELSLAQPSQHLFHVTMTVPEVHGELLFQMPAWNALYQIRDFSSRVQRVEAASGSEPLAIAKLDKLTWSVHAAGAVAIRYAVYWDSAGPFASQLNEEHAFINPAMVLMYVPDRRKESVSVTFRDVPHAWRAESPLLASATEAASLKPLEAPGYDALVDAPIELGAFSEFTIPGIAPAVRVAIHGDGWKQAEVENALAKICAYQIELMGGAPFERYLFIYHIGKAAMGAGGGMEHANSTAINLSSGAQIAGVSAHEFFHLWNVKRLRPSSLEPIDYTREQFTRALWFAEGVTSTYGSFTLVRSGIWSKQDFYNDLARQINELESRPANRWQSAEQSSLDTWLDKYDYYNGPEFSVSYYTKGQVLGLLLDILIRDRTLNARSLDDVLRKMNQEFAQKGRTYRDSLDVRLSAEEISGASFEEFFRRYVQSAEPLPYESVFAKAGWLLRQQEVVRAELGFSFERDGNGKAAVRSVAPGSTAERAGLLAGDEIIQWNGESVPRRGDSWLHGRKPGEALKLRVLRNGQPLEIALALGGKTSSMLAVAEDPQASPQARAIREGLLRGKTAAAH